MGAMLGRVIDDYRGLVQTCQQRAIELEISRLEIDRLAGLAPGYSAKLLGNTDHEKQKRMWPIGLEALIGTLGLKILLIEDTAATARTLALRKPVDPANQRFGNKNNSKSSLNTEPESPAPAKPAMLISSASNEGGKIITACEPAKLATPRQDKPAPASRSHLRVVQLKKHRSGRVRKYG